MNSNFFFISFGIFCAVTVKTPASALDIAYIISEIQASDSIEELLASEQVLSGRNIVDGVPKEEKIPVKCSYISVLEGPRVIVSASERRIYEFLDLKRISFNGIESLNISINLEEYKCISDKLKFPFIIVKNIMKFGNRRDIPIPDFVYYQTYRYIDENEKYKRMILRDFSRYDIQEIKTKEELEAASGSAAKTTTAAGPKRYAAGPTGRAEGAEGPAEPAEGQSGS